MIFFVISGYLISGIIYENLERGSFTLTGFYVRRIKRIFPALVLVLASCYAVGWFLLLPKEYAQLGKHMAAGAGFVANLTLWFESGYFDPAAHTKPLLHLWSLGIEEQFYIVWPLLLGVVWGWRKSFLATALVIAVASFAAGVYVLGTDPVAAFYSPLLRLWELMLGALLAYVSLHRPALLMSRGNLKASLGLLAIVLGLVLIDSGRSFPGWWALLPTLGAVLVIAAGPHAWLNRSLLGHPVMVGVGLISYPLYLWHWPLLTLARLIAEKTPATGVRVAAVLISIVLAWLTYRLVELPIRAKARCCTAGALVILMGGVGVLGYVTYAGGGLAWRGAIAPYVGAAWELDYLNHWVGWHSCGDQGPVKGCRILDPARKPDVALVGDSHAGHLASGLGDIFRRREENVVVRLSAGCLPVFELRTEAGARFVCSGGSMNQALQDVIVAPWIKVVILSGYANQKIETTRFLGPGRELDRKQGQAAKDNAVLFERATRLTLERLVGAGKRVIFLVDVPELYVNPRECVPLRRFTLPGQHLIHPCSIARGAFDLRTELYHRAVANLVQDFPMVKFIDLYRPLCHGDACNIMLGNDLLYSSYDHLSPTGSRYVVKEVADEILEVLEGRSPMPGSP